MNIVSFPLWISMMACLWLAACQSNKPQAFTDQQRAHLHYQLGVDALKQHQLPKAFSELMLANQLAPEQSETLDALAYAWRMRGDTEKAESFYLQAIDTGEQAAIRNHYASFLIEMKRYEDAKAQLEMALSDPTYPHQDIAYIDLGDVFLALGNPQAAKDAYTVATHINPLQITAKHKLALLYVSEGNDDGAIQQYQSILDARPDEKATLKLLLPILERNNLFDIMRNYLLLFRQHAKSSHDLAWVEDELHDLGAAP